MCLLFFFFKQKTAYEMRISDWSSDVCSSDLRRAADWFYARGMHEDAIHHAIAARNYVLAVEIMNVWADRLIVDANLATVERWSDALPLEEIAKHPELAVQIAWALVFLRRHPKLRPLLTILEGASDQGKNGKAR